MTQLLTSGASFPFSQVSWLLNFIETRHASFDISNITNYIEMTRSVMPKPVYLLTVQEAHKEYNSVTDQIWAKYEQLDSDKYGAVSTPAFHVFVQPCKIPCSIQHGPLTPLTYPGSCKSCFSRIPVLILLLLLLMFISHDNLNFPCCTVSFSSINCLATSSFE